MSVIKLQYLYYKSDNVQERIRDRLQQRGRPEEISRVYFVENSCKVIADLVLNVHKFGQPKLRVKATLFQVYHLALHNQIEEAKDLLMKTQMSSVIHLQQIENQVLYNRALTQIGLSAFRVGRIQESYDILVDICSHPRFKEFLAQSVSKVQNKTIELVDEERRRLIPYHM